VTRALGIALVAVLVLATLGEGGARPEALLLTHGLVVALLAVAVSIAPARTLPWTKAPVALFLAFAALVAVNAALSPYAYAAFLVLLEIGAFLGVGLLAARHGPDFPASASLGLLAAAAGQSLWVVGQWIAGQPRPAGTFLNPSHLAAWLAAVLLLALGSSAPGRWSRVRVALSVPVVVALFSTGSRGALLGLAVGIALLLREALLARTGRRARLAVAALALVVVCAVTAGVLVRFREADPFRYERLSIWRASLVMTAESPVRGTGPGQLPDAALNHNFPTAAGPLRFEKYFTGTHSDLLRPFAELGIPTAAVLFLALGLAIRSFAGRGGNRGSALGTKAALACLGVHALVENLSERPAVYLLAAALVGSLLSVPAGSRSVSRPRRVWLAAGLVALFVVGDVAPYLAWSSVRGLPRGALTDLDAERLARARRHNPLHPDFDLRTAEALAGDGRDWAIEDYARAREAAERAVRKAPRSAAYHVGRARLEALACGRLFRDQATRARARALYEGAASLSRHDALIPLEESLFLLGAADLPAARRAAERALALEPEAVAPRIVLAEVALGSGLHSGPEAARRLLDAAQERAERHRPFASTSRYARELLGWDEAAAREIRRRIEAASTGKGGG
jgi:O-antigen ligase